jgi:uncharacterized protein
MTSKNKIVIIYHQYCSDGFGAAWAAWKKFGNKAEYVGIKPRDDIPAGLSGRVVYLLDISFPPDLMKVLLKRAEKVIALDHHISARESTEMADEYVFKNNHSGAVIAWDYFHPNEKIPLMLRQIEDFDIWKWEMKHTEEFMASIGVKKHDFKEWSKIVRDWETAKGRAPYIMEGNTLLTFQRTIVDRALDDAEEVELDGIRALATNSIVRLASNIGEAIRQAGYKLAIIWQKKSGKMIVSLRSAGNVDASKIASRFGGGGHKHAAAFEVAEGKKVPWKVIKKQKN